MQMNLSKIKSKADELITNNLCVPIIGKNFDISKSKSKSKYKSKTTIKAKIINILINVLIIKNLL